jgi:hypothetical protein
MISQKCKTQYGKLKERTVHRVVMRSIDRKEMTEGYVATRHRGQTDGEVFADTKFSCCPVARLERLDHVNDTCMKCKKVYKTQVKGCTFSVNERDFSGSVAKLECIAIVRPKDVCSFTVIIAFKMLARPSSV